MEWSSSTQTAQDISTEDLPVLWRQEAQRQEALKNLQTAAAFMLAAEQLEQTLEASGDVLLSLQEAADYSGYSAGHLGRMVRDGKIPNHGRKGAPRIPRRHLTQKAIAPLNRNGYNTSTQIVRSAIQGGN